MELAEKYVTLEVQGKTIAHMFGGEDSGDDTRWHLVGQMAGETPGVGIWLRMLGMVSPIKDEVWKEGAALYLVRWEWLLNATVLPDRPKSLKEVGFRREAK